MKKNSLFMSATCLFILSTVTNNTKCCCKQKNTQLVTHTNNQIEHKNIKKSDQSLKQSLNEQKFTTKIFINIRSEKNILTAIKILSSTLDSMKILGNPEVDVIFAKIVENRLHKKTEETKKYHNKKTEGTKTLSFLNSALNRMKEMERKETKEEVKKELLQRNKEISDNLSSFTNYIPFWIEKIKRNKKKQNCKKMLKEVSLKAKKKKTSELDPFINNIDKILEKLYF